MMGNRYPRKSLILDDCYGCPHLSKRKCRRKGYCLRHIKGFMKRYYRKWYKKYIEKLEVN